MPNYATQSHYLFIFHSHVALSLPRNELNGEHGSRVSNERTAITRTPSLGAWGQSQGIPSKNNPPLFAGAYMHNLVLLMTLCDAHVFL